MKAICQLKGITPYGQNGFIKSIRDKKELHADFEDRTWQERMHVDDNGEVYIPAMALKNCIAEAAQFLGEKIPGKGNATWSKHFQAGILVLENAPLGIKAKDVIKYECFVPSDGKKGGGTRVLKYFPKIVGWEAIVEFHIIDSTITKDKFVEYLEQAGNFIGIGWFRPRRGGTWGRFHVLDVKWEE